AAQDWRKDAPICGFDRWQADVNDGVRQPDDYAGLQVSAGSQTMFVLTGERMRFVHAPAPVATAAAEPPVEPKAETPTKPAKQAAPPVPCWSRKRKRLPPICPTTCRLP